MTEARRPAQHSTAETPTATSAACGAAMHATPDEVTVGAIHQRTACTCPATQSGRWSSGCSRCSRWRRPTKQLVLRLLRELAVQSTWLSKPSSLSALRDACPLPAIACCLPPAAYQRARNHPSPEGDEHDDGDPRLQLQRYVHRCGGDVEDCWADLKHHSGQHGLNRVGACEWRKEVEEWSKGPCSVGEGRAVEAVEAEGKLHVRPSHSLPPAR